MNRQAIARTAAALLTVIAAASAMAQGMSDSSLARHGRFLRGDGPMAQASQAPAMRLLPGPRAQQMIYLGTDPAVAIEQARALGEQPIVQMPTPEARRANGTDLYDRIAERAAPSMQDGVATAVR